MFRHGVAGFWLRMDDNVPIMVTLSTEQPSVANIGMHEDSHGYAEKNRLQQSLPPSTAGKTEFGENDSYRHRRQDGELLLIHLAGKPVESFKMLVQQQKVK